MYFYGTIVGNSKDYQDVVPQTPKKENISLMLPMEKMRNMGQDLQFLKKCYPLESEVKKMGHTSYG